MQKFKGEQRAEELRQQSLLLRTLSDIASNSYDAVAHLRMPGWQFNRHFLGGLGGHFLAELESLWSFLASSPEVARLLCTLFKKLSWFSLNKLLMS